jgi:hypothetical protein
MGANAQTTVPTFTSGQVLTAAQMNDSARTGVPVFADTSARDAGFGGTGEKTLAEGQLCYLEDSDVVQYYDGSSWATVGPASAGGFVLISGETAFTAVSSVTVDNVFSATYRNYKLIVNYTSTSSSISFRVRAGGSSISTTTYNFQRLFAGSTTITASRSTSQTQFIACPLSSNQASAEITIYQPFIATPTNLSTYTAVSDGGMTFPDLDLKTGNNSNSTSYDGFELFVGTGTMTGTYTIYGMATS